MVVPAGHRGKYEILSQAKKHYAIIVIRIKQCQSVREGGEGGREEGGETRREGGRKVGKRGEREGDRRKGETRREGGN